MGGANLTISDLMVSFNVTRKGDQKATEGTVGIYNLNESHETLVRDRGVSVNLEAGYPGGRFGLIASGDIRKVQKERIGLDRVIRIHIGGHVKERAEAFVMLAYEGIVPLRTIISDAIAQGFPSLVAGSLHLIPGTAVEEDFSFSGQANSVLTGLLAPHNLLWYEDNGVIRITMPKQTNDDRSGGGIVVVSQRSGMIGSPTITDEGLLVKTLLDHRIGIDTRLRVQSEILDFAASGDAANARAIEGSSGDWKSIRVTHTGDNRDGQFQTEAELRSL